MGGIVGRIIILALAALASCEVAGCKMDDPPTRLRTCLANMDWASGPAGQDVECDLGKRSYLIAGWRVADTGHAERHRS